ncbi:hypothetical protein [Paraburkholderia sp. UYCP14C]|nr:hypothetical protein [Paraburkholderia sp. UYCP14C]
MNQNREPITIDTESHINPQALRPPYAPLNVSKLITMPRSRSGA